MPILNVTNKNNFNCFKRLVTDRHHRNNDFLKFRTLKTGLIWYEIKIKMQRNQNLLFCTQESIVASLSCNGYDVCITLLVLGSTNILIL